MPVDMIDHSPLAVIKWGNGAVLQWNHAAETLFGYAREEVLSATSADRPGGNVAALSILLSQIPTSHDPARTRRKHVTATGASVVVQWATTTYEDPDGSSYTLAFGLDVSESARAIEALEQSNDLLHAIIDAAPTAIIGLDLEGKVHSVWNRAAETMLGWRADEVMGKFLPSVPTDRHAEFESFRNRVRLGQSLLGVDVERKRRDGSPIEYSIYTSALHDRQGAITGNVAVLVDIGERKRAEREKADLEEQLRQAQKLEAVGRLAGGIAHDFNNMLGVILGYAELLRTQLTSPMALADLSEIDKAAKRSREMTGQLLALSRKQTIEPKVVALNEVIAKTERTLARLVGEDVSLAFVPAPALWAIKVDVTQIEQVLMNLVINARDAMPSGGRISIETNNVVFDDAYCRVHLGFSSGRYVTLSVSDDGVGMDRDTLAHIFEPFFTTKPPGKGTGLGLATVYGIVRQNEGFIHAYSEPGRGTVIRIYLPESTEASQPPEQKHATVERLTETVLLVEDEGSVREMIARMLRSIGCEVIVARSAEEALDLCADPTATFAVLLTDVVMPGLNGRELSERVQDLRPDTKTIFMSGYTANVIAHRGVLKEGVHLLPKPFTLRELARKLEEVLALRRSMLPHA